MTRTNPETSLVAEWLGLPGLTVPVVVTMAQDARRQSSARALHPWQQARAARLMIMQGLKEYAFTYIVNETPVIAGALARAALAHVDWTRLALDLMELLDETGEVGSCAP